MSLRGSVVPGEIPLNKTSSFLLLLLGLLVGIPAARMTTSPAKTAAPAAKPAPAVQPEPPAVEATVRAAEGPLDREDCKPDAPKAAGSAPATTPATTAAPSPLHPWCLP